MARPRHLRLSLILAAALASAAVSCDFACGRIVEPVVLATTTSVGNSGLLDHLLAGYAGATVRPLLVGSGRALDMLASRTADVVISHSPLRETAAMADEPSWFYRKILFNDFLIVGPSQDPAGVRHARDAGDAMARIAASGHTFLSRGDESGTHERERELWRLAGVAPDPQRVVVAGAGMGQTLRVASGTAAYTLTDRGTYEALRGSLDLAILHEGDPRLLNTYAVIASPHSARGLAFARWLTEGAGRRRLVEAAGAVPGFNVWPEGAPAEDPEALPRRPDH